MRQLRETCIGWVADFPKGCPACGNYFHPVHFDIRNYDGIVNVVAYCGTCHHAEAEPFALPHPREVKRWEADR